MSRFVLKKVNTGMKFDLYAGNGQDIVSSEVYSSRGAVLRGIESVRKNASKAHFEDLTLPEESGAPNPKFELYRDKGGQFRFRLRSRNGKIIAVSDSYSTKAAAISGLESVRKNAAEAILEE
jgi:uncharacterized protein YegP (UPF0339 family)